jgi:N-acetyl-anhydromuramyl-L-alanine amidase AmpD
MILFEKPKRTVSKIFLHCSASDNPKHDNVETITKWHIERGFITIGYHYFISKDGVVHKGRSLETVPSAQQGHNTGSIAICLHGLDKDKFTEAQFISLRNLIFVINTEYQHKLSIHGHCEVSAKSCPVFDYKKMFSLDSNGFIRFAK